MIYCLYEVTNLVTGKIYVGAHGTENPDDSYLGSGKLVKLSVEKHGRANFSKRILGEFDNDEELVEAEKQMVDKEFVGRKDTYNLVVGGGCGGLSATTRKKISKSATGKIRIHEPASGNQKIINPSDLESFKEKGWKRGVSEAFKNNGGRIWIHNSSGKQRMVDPSELESFLENSWIQGMPEATRQKLRKANVGKIWIHNSDGKGKMVVASELESFLENGWGRGRPSSNFKSRGTKT